MSRTDFDAPDFPHGLTGYSHGCPCRICCRANTEKCRRARQARAERKREAKNRPDNVVQMRRGTRQSEHTGHVHIPTESDDSKVSTGGRPTWKPRPLDEIGRVEQAVIDQCAELEEAQALSAMVMNARSVARVLDDPRQISQHSSASRQLQSILVELTGGAKAQKDKRKTGSRASRLGAIAGMTKVSRAQ